MSGKLSKRRYYIGDGYNMTATPNSLFLTFDLENCPDHPRWQDLKVGERTTLVGRFEPIKGHYYNVQRMEDYDVRKSKTETSCDLASHKYSVDSGAQGRDVCGKCRESDKCLFALRGPGGSD